MKEKYIFMGIILVLGYIVTSMIAKAFKNTSAGNSIKLEEKITFENISFLIEGIICIFLVYLVSLFKKQLIIPVFYIELVLLIFVFLKFAINLIKEVIGYAQYSKIGSMWSIISVQFIKVIVISYLVYNYYTIYI